MKHECGDSMEMGYSAPDEVEARIDDACRAADVTGIQKEIVLLFLADGMTLPQIRLKLHLKRHSEVQRELLQGLKKLADKEPDFWRAAGKFPHDLVFCAADRRVYDERPEGLSGVTPDRASDRLHSGRVIAGDDRRLKQPLPDAGRLWARSLLGSIA